MFVAKLPTRFKVVNDIYSSVVKVAPPKKIDSVKWRIEHGYPDNLRSRGTLTDNVDFTYLDGRPTPYTTGQRARILRQKEYAEQIVELMDVVKLAKTRYQEKITAMQEERQKILDRKLKPKGLKRMSIKRTTQV